jgi:hypothetical protein
MKAIFLIISMCLFSCSNVGDIDTETDDSGPCSTLDKCGSVDFETCRGEINWYSADCVLVLWNLEYCYSENGCYDFECEQRESMIADHCPEEIIP